MQAVGDWPSAVVLIVVAVTYESHRLNGLEEFENILRLIRISFNDTHLSDIDFIQWV